MTLSRTEKVSLSLLIIDWLKSLEISASLKSNHDIYPVVHDDWTLLIDNRRVGWIDDEDATFECCHSPEGLVCGGKWRAVDPEFFDKVWSHLKFRNTYVEHDENDLYSRTI